jgi:hypothetical protein
MSSSGDFIIENGVLKKYIGPGGDVVIPKGVTQIGGSAFEGNTALISVTVPDSVTFIYGGAFAGAFRGCSNLKKLVLPDSKVFIGEDAFKDCPALADENGLVIFNARLFECYGNGGFVTVPEGVTDICGAFFENSSVTGVGLPESTAASLTGREFYHCSNLEMIRLPEGMRRIPPYLFEGCGKLKELHLPDSVTAMDINAVEGCHSLKYIAGPNVTEIREVKAENPLCLRGGPLVMVCPQMPLHGVYRPVLKNRLTLGFFGNQELYAPQIAEEYRKYACRDRLYLLPDVFRLDLVQALDFYDRNKKIKPKDFEKEWLEPAEKAGAVQCKAWLLDWRGRHKPKKDPFELSL